MEDLAAFADSEWNPDFHQALDYLWPIMDEAERKSFLNITKTQQSSSSMSTMVSMLSQERSKRVVANADYHLHGTRRSPTMAYVNHSFPRTLILASFADAIFGSVLLPSRRAEEPQVEQWLHQLHSSSLILGPKWDVTRLGITFPQGMIRTTSFILDLLEMEFRLPTHSML